MLEKVQSSHYSKKLPILYFTCEKRYKIYINLFYDKKFRSPINYLKTLVL